MNCTIIQLCKRLHVSYRVCVYTFTCTQPCCCCCCCCYVQRMVEWEMITHNGVRSDKQMVRVSAW